MKNKSEFIRRNLSAVSLIAIYVITVMIHLFADSFILINQIGILVTMLPFILLGLVLDFILRHNKTIDNGIRLLAGIMPAAIFAVYLFPLCFLETLLSSRVPKTKQV
ncbi:MAG: hypothetical protein K0R46_1198 [Herbinix sp.]|jgi:amino acid transporter|nr:hypothetical protein [Herbinix sp.]